MIRRFFSSIKNDITKNLNKNCFDCRLYNRTTKLCKLNNLYASENRIHNDVCGIDGRKYFALDKTNLINSNKYLKYSTRLLTFTISSFPFIIVYDFRVAILTTLSLLYGNMLEMLSKDYKKQYLEDNNISENDL